MERFCLINVQKSLNGLTPNIGFEWNNNSQKEAMLKIPKLAKVRGRASTVKESSHLVQGSKLFNALPLSLRKVKSMTADSYKKRLDSFLSLLPDEPYILGLTPEVTNYLTGKPSNILSDVINHHKVKVNNFEQSMLETELSKP